MDWIHKKSLAGRGCIHRRAILYKEPWCELFLDEGAYVEEGAILRCCNDGGQAVEVNSAIRLGKRTFVGQYCNLRTGGGSIDIGDDVLLAQFVSVIASGHGTKAGAHIREQGVADKKGVRIGDGAWIGVGAVILPGVSIGEGAVIGAGAIVTRDVPANAIAVGNPAKVLRYRG